MSNVHFDAGRTKRDSTVAMQGVQGLLREKKNVEGQ